MILLIFQKKRESIYDHNKTGTLRSDYNTESLLYKYIKNLLICQVLYKNLVLFE